MTPEFFFLLHLFGDQIIIYTLITGKSRYTGDNIFIFMNNDRSRGHNLKVLDLTCLTVQTYSAPFHFITVCTSYLKV